MLVKPFNSVVLPLCCGLIVGIFLTVNYNYQGDYKSLSNGIKKTRSVDSWNRTLAEKLHKEVRVLCWILTNPENHKTKAFHLKNTWGKRCNKLLIMSSTADDLIGSIALPVFEGRSNLWDKTKAAFQYAYRNHPDYDYYLKADDDTYIVMENLRYFLYQYRPQTALYFGHRFAVEVAPFNYMAGGFYVLSKKAVEKLVLELLPREDLCRYDAGGAEDFEMGKCLANYAIPVDTRDELKQIRFFPVGPEEHFPSNYTTYWYYDYLYYEAKRGLDCCSNTFIGTHYVEPAQFYFLEYLIYRASAFGINKDITTKLPRKLTLQEVLDVSDDPSTSKNNVEHEIVHYLNDSEKYRKK